MDGEACTKSYRSVMRNALILICDSDSYTAIVYVPVLVSSTWDYYYYHYHGRSPLEELACNCIGVSFVECSSA